MGNIFLVSQISFFRVDPHRCPKLAGVIGAPTAIETSCGSAPLSEQRAKLGWSVGLEMETISFPENESGSAL